jgi:hypothetical protein
MKDETEARAAAFWIAVDLVARISHAFQAPSQVECIAVRASIADSITARDRIPCRFY